MLENILSIRDLACPPPPAAAPADAAGAAEDSTSASAEGLAPVAVRSTGYTLPLQRAGLRVTNETAPQAQPQATRESHTAHR